MPPSMKALKFDLTLLTGTFQQNMKRAFDSAKKAFKDFGDSMKKSNSFLDASNAIYMFGKQGVEAITSLFHPYEALVGKVVAVGVAVKAACKNFEEFEKAGLKASNAFKTGGIVKDFDKFKGMIQNQTAGGMGNVTDAMGALGSVRKSNPALNSGEFSAIAELSTGAAAFNGEEYADAFERLGDILGSDAVSLDKLTSAGINFTFNEWQQVKAMNNRMMMHERNRIIIEKMKQTYKDAEKAEANTLSGMYRRIGNMLENLKVKLGEAIAPLAKPFFQLAVLIMNLAEGFVKPFVGIAKVIGAVFSPLTKLLTQCTGLCKTIGTILGIIVVSHLAKWVVNQKLIIKGYAMIFNQLMACLAAQRKMAAANAPMAVPHAITIVNRPATLASAAAPVKGGFFKGFGKGMKGIGSTLATGIAVGWRALVPVLKNVSTVISAIIKGLGAAIKVGVKFSGVGTAIALAIEGFFYLMKGVFAGFQAANKDAEGATGVIKTCWGVISQLFRVLWKLVETLMSILKPIWWLCEKLGYAIGYLSAMIYKGLGSLLTAIETGLDKLNDMMSEGYFKFWEFWGYDMSKERDEYNDKKKQKDKKDDKGYLAPDIDFSSSFESAASMTQRIQTALVSKNSPQAKMVDYLHDIRDYMKGMNDAQNKQVEAQREDNALMKEQNKALGNMNMGLA